MNEFFEGAKMRLNLILGGWFLDGEATRQQLPPIRNPSDVDIANTLKYLRDRIGVVVLRTESAESRDLHEVVLYADSGKYLPMLNGYDKDENSVTRTFNNDNGKNELTFHHRRNVLSEIDRE